MPVLPFFFRTTLRIQKDGLFRVTRKVRRRKSLRKPTREEVAIAKEIVVQQVNQLNREQQFRVGRVSVRNQRTRWGSCSRLGNISINYRIQFLPNELQAYVVLHELCHTIEFHHQRAFWQLMQQHMPDALVRRRALKRVLLR